MRKPPTTVRISGSGCGQWRDAGIAQPGPASMQFPAPTPKPLAIVPAWLDAILPRQVLVLSIISPPGSGPHPAPLGDYGA